MKRLLTQFAGILLEAYGVTLRITCRIHLHNDQRQAVSDLGYRYVFGTGHAYQISGLIAAEQGTGAMVSRSLDGGLVSTDAEMVPVMFPSAAAAVRAEKVVAPLCRPSLST